ncbi:MAG TPA: fibrinogen-like YCDxxxxGGGW domain-containing protein [Labilithrix sp.]|jgi:hypothetical protein
MHRYLLVVSAAIVSACSSSSSASAPPGDAGAPPADAQAPPAPPPAPQGIPAASCAEHYTNGERTSGVFVLTIFGEQPISVYCDMDTEGGGWTLAATRGATPGTTWQNGESKLGHDLTNPMAETDNILPVDWSKLSIRDVDYELDDYQERVEFRGISTDFASKARAAMTSYVPLAMRPTCNFAATSHPDCGDSDPGIEQSTGWVWDLTTNGSCFWADASQSGAGKCDGTTGSATKGRVWIR